MLTKVSVQGLQFTIDVVKSGLKKPLFCQCFGKFLFLSPQVFFGAAGTGFFISNIPFVVDLVFGFVFDKSECAGRGIVDLAFNTCLFLKKTSFLS